MRVQIAVFKFSNLGPSRTFWNLGYLRRKQPGSHGRAGWQASPSFSDKKGKEGRTKMFNPPGIWDSLKISEKNYFREENPSRGASITFPWVISRRFSTILRRSSSFFGLQPVSSRNRTFQFILCTLSGPHLFSRAFIFISFTFRIPFWRA